jgi:hypothetical protein
MKERRRLRIALACIEFFIGVNGLVAGPMLIRDSWHLPMSWLARTPFRSWVIPGIALFVFVGIGEVVAALYLLAGGRYARELSVFAVVGLCAWIVVQVGWLRVFSVLQPTIFVVGAVIAVLALRLPRRPKPPGLRPYVFTPAARNT